MPPPVFADRPAQPPERGTVDALITRTRSLRVDVDAVRREAEDEDEAQARWQRALCELALHQLDDLGNHLGQLKEGPPLPPAEIPEGPAVRPPRPPQGSLLSRVGSAEWNLLTDEASWSPELYQIFGRNPESTPLTLDELPALLLPEDQPLLTARVTDCLIDGKPIDIEFRVSRADGSTRTLHMMGEPVLDADGGTASMWAVVRDVSELRRTQRVVRETGDSLRERRREARAEHRLTVELQEAVLPAWRGSLGLPHAASGTLDLAAHYLPSCGTLAGGDWYDALELPGGEMLLSVGDLTGHGVTAASGMAVLLGALRGMAMAGTRPGPLMGLLNQMLDVSVQPVLGSAVCARYHPATRTLSWAQAGHPAPLLFRDGTGHALTPPDGVLLGALSGAVYEQAEARLRPGDLLVLHTDGLTSRRESSRSRLLALAPRFTGARSAQDCVRAVVEEFGEAEREDDACVLIARIGS